MILCKLFHVNEFFYLYILYSYYLKVYTFFSWNKAFKLISIIPHQMSWTRAEREEEVSRRLPVLYAPSESMGVSLWSPPGRRPYAEIPHCRACLQHTSSPWQHNALRPITESTTTVLMGNNVCNRGRKSVTL